MSEKIIVNSIICPSRRTSFSFSLSFSLFFSLSHPLALSFPQVCRLRFAADIEFRDLLVREWTPEFSRNVKRVLPPPFVWIPPLSPPISLRPSRPSLTLSHSLSLSSRFSELTAAAFPFVFLSSFRFSRLSFLRSAAPAAFTARRNGTVFPWIKARRRLRGTGTATRIHATAIYGPSAAVEDRILYSPRILVPFKHAV